MQNNGTVPDLSGLTRKGRRIAEALLKKNLSEPPSYNEIVSLTGEKRDGAVFKEVLSTLWPGLVRRGRGQRSPSKPPNDNIGRVTLALGRVNDLATKYGGVTATLTKLREVSALHEDCRPLGGAAQVAEFLELLLSLQGQPSQ